MSRKSSPYAEYIRALEKKRARNPDTSSEMNKWRAFWRKAGPVRFAEEVLACPQDVPPHPGLADKDHPKGQVPEFIILAEFQKSFLLDLASVDPERARQLILAAGRGCGKTFCIAIYTCWRICCFDFFTMTVMGGSAEQSNMIKSYIDYWRMTDNNVMYCLWKSRGGSGPTCATVFSRWFAYGRFPPCSETAARGPHVTQVMIDEVCVGESKSTGGAKAVRSARGQLTSSPNSMLVYTSTAHYIFGTFFTTWRDWEKKEWKRYRWTTGRHSSEQWYKAGTTEENWDYIDTVLIRDRNEKNWVSNVWWIADKDIQLARLNGTDDEFVVEVLGGISRGSGLVFGRDDLQAAICKGEVWNKGEECELCDPYTENCPMMKAMGWGSLGVISNRKMGVDFGSVSPNSMTITGTRGKMIYVLHSDEHVSSTEDILKWIDEYGKKYSIYEIVADPEERAMREALELKNYSTPHLWAYGGGAKKAFYGTKLKRFMEKHRFFIPVKFTYLINSISELAYDTRGKIRKANDHSYDSLLYATAFYEIDTNIADFWKASRGNLTIWG